MSSQAVFVGNLTRDVEVRFTKNNTAVANASVACNEFYTDKAGEKQKRTSYINLEAWGYTAQDMGELTKGTKVVVVASPRFVTKQEGEKGELVFSILEIGVCPRANKDGGGTKAAPKETTKKVVKKSTKTVEVEADVDDEVQSGEDIPF